MNVAFSCRVGITHKLLCTVCMLSQIFLHKNVHIPSKHIPEKHQKDGPKSAKERQNSPEADWWYHGKRSGTLRNSERQSRGLVNYSAPRRTGGTVVASAAGLSETPKDNRVVW